MWKRIFLRIMAQPHIVPTHQLKKLIPHSAHVTQIISQSELERIRENAVSVKEQEEATLKATQSRVATKERQVSDRAERLKQADQTRRERLPQTTEERLNTLRRQQLLDGHERAQIERDDVAKLLNTLVIEAKVNAVRDRQLAIAQRAKVEEQLEKEQDRSRNQEVVEQLRAEEERRLAAKMRELEELEAACTAETVRKEREKLLEEEEKLRQGEEFNKFMQQQTELEIKLAKEQQEERKRANLEGLRINEEQERLREQKKQLEREEDERILEHIKKEDYLEQQRIMKEEEQRIERDKKWAEELAKKQGQSNVLEAIETARERAALEKQEREFAAKEKARKDKMEQERIELLEAKAASEVARQTEALKTEKEMAVELQGARHSQKEWQLMLLEEREKAVANQIELKDMYEKEIELKTQRINEENPKDDELEQIKQKEAQLKEMLEALKQEKIEELRAAGVDEKYFESILKLDIEKALRK